MNNQHKDVFLNSMGDMMPKLIKLFKPKLSKKMLKGMIDMRVGVPDIGVMKVVATNNGGIKISEIGSALGIQFAMMTRIIDRVEAAGLVERVRDKSDRRAYKIRLTQKGKEFHNRAREMHKKHFASIIERFRSKDREDFLKAVHVIANIIKKY